MGRKSVPAAGRDPNIEYRQSTAKPNNGFVYIRVLGIHLITPVNLN